MSRRINSIKIENFRQYHNVQLDFNKRDTISDLNIVIGDNRFGKTNLLNSLLWALYDENISNNKAPVLSIKNERYANEDVCVSINFDNTEDINENEIVKRTLSNGLSLIKKDKISNKYMPSESPRVDIGNILAKSVANLFLFRGEYLETFFGTQNKQLLKDTVQKVSKIDKLIIMSDILESLEKKYRKEIAKISISDKNVSKLADEINDLVLKKKTIQNHIESNEGTTKEYGLRADEIKRCLLGFNEKQINFILSEEDRLKEFESDLISQIIESKKKAFDLLINKISFWFLYNGIKDLKNKLNDMEDQGLLPPPVNPQTIMNIFEYNRCICGNDLNQEMRSTLELLLQSVTTTKSNLEILYKINLSLYAEKDEFKKILASINDIVTKKSQSEQKLEQVRRDLKSVAEELKNINEEDINALQTEKEMLEEAIGQLEADTSQNKAILYKCEYDLTDKQTEFNKKSSRISGTGLLTKKLDFTSTLREKTNLIYGNIIEEIRNDLNKKTKNRFKDLFWDNYKFMDYEIKLNKNFELEVLSPHKNNMINNLSTGEQKVLALSFMTALSDFYGFDFPLVIDAPFTALQKEVIINVLDNLINISKKKQVIIFMIPQEEYIMKKLYENANIVYKLKKDGEENTTVELVK